MLVACGDAATLLSIIERFIVPGTTIYSDQWKAYNYISRLPHDSTHETVNHSLNFVSPETLAHTHNVENMWMYAKMKKKSSMEQHVTRLQTHLVEFMWPKISGDRPFEN